MKTTPVDRITVKDIAEGCGLTRQTFYRNFKDKYDLINWYFDKLVQQSLGQIETGSRVRESLARKLAFIQEEKAFFCGTFRSDDHNSLKEHDFELILQFMIIFLPAGSASHWMMSCSFSWKCIAGDLSI